MRLLACASSESQTSLLAWLPSEDKACLRIRSLQSAAIHPLGGCTAILKFIAAQSSRCGHLRFGERDRNKAETVV